MSHKKISNFVAIYVEKSKYFVYLFIIIPGDNIEQRRRKIVAQPLTNCYFEFPLQVYIRGDDVICSKLLRN